ncbi:MAG: TIGR03894 family protein [Synechococcus sp. MED-G71]|jgi:uncharacterized repeat protein (TIGR03894 family)|nr:MAG: TIGR03894 family protein [Synechococcus sp. MED-G71]RPF78228.1 MAG: TIGR03894 family protein [Synechococcus sp. TMED155]|tara:strand:+ start:2272 stop:2568 length:297 start_codon:yes stop_codon:yes gene_type:complete
MSEDKTTDKELLQEVGKELWSCVNKLRPGLPKQAKAQLTLKALLTIGDLQDQLGAAMVLGVVADLEPDDAPEPSSDDSAPEEAISAAERTTRKRSSKN